MWQLCRGGQGPDSEFGAIATAINLNRQGCRRVFRLKRAADIGFI